MICPQCNTGIHVAFGEDVFFKTVNKLGRIRGWKTRFGQCPECREAIIYLGSGAAANNLPHDRATTLSGYTERVVEPVAGSRPCPPEVPKPLARDFLEAAAVLSISPQASAALSRRCLQHLLRDYAGASGSDLAKQIDQVLASNLLPSSTGGQLDAVRSIGNFAAHPLKSTSSGEIIPVEPEESEWNLDVLEELFDHFFVKPARSSARKAALNLKLAEAGKPTLP